MEMETGPGTVGVEVITRRTLRTLAQGMEMGPGTVEAEAITRRPL